MDKNAIKKYAVWARRELIERVSRKALQYGIAEETCGDVNADKINGYLLTDEEKKQRHALIAKIEKAGYRQVMEEAAYTWFNRFCALRYMEVNGYLPTHVRVFSDDRGNFKPQILTEAIHLELDGLDMEKVYTLKERNKTDELYKYLLITQCNALSAILPGMFQKIADYTELLFPDNILREGSVIERMITLIPEEDWTDQVQIIGWLYQYYNTEPKDEVFAALKKNIKISKENIPAATQLFTPDWIVHYMVENSLGRIYTEGSVESGEWSEGERITKEKAIAEKMGWKYYLPEAEQTPEVRSHLATSHYSLATDQLTSLKVIDPCMGSGHILVVMFDVLMQIYESYGYRTRDAASMIVENNLWGLDIDERAAQLSYFAVMMKARQYDSRFFSRKVEPHVYAIEESNGITTPPMHDMGIELSQEECVKAVKETLRLVEELHDAKGYGSIIHVTPCDWDLLRRFAVPRGESEGQMSLDIHGETEAAKRLQKLIDIGETLAQKYDVVCTNPPYMGSSNMNPKLNEYIKEKYADYKSDFFSAFVVRASEMTTANGYCGFFTPYVWMFIQSYEKLRRYLYTRATIETLIQFEYSAFEEATVPVCTFVFGNSHVKGKKGNYLRLVDFRGGMEVQRQKTLEAIADHHCGYYYEQTTDNFSKIPGSPVAYWVSEGLLSAFTKGKSLGDIALARNGMKTGQNGRFVRFWWEVVIQKFNSIATDWKEASTSGAKWFPYNKGGEFRKWYGNNDCIVNWENEGNEIFNHAKADNRNVQDYPLELKFKPSVSWSLVTSGQPAFRYKENNLFDIAGMSFFTKKEELLIFLGFCNSKVAIEVLKVLAPTINFQAGDIGRLPIVDYGVKAGIIRELVLSNIENSSTDWDSYETSWDFKRHPMLNCGKISDAYEAWKAGCESRFFQLKTNEEELNRIFIDIYGLQDELTPEVADKDVTVHRVFDTKDDVPESMRGSNYVRTLRDEIVSLISYAVGCLFGRYSPYVDGLFYAGGDWNAKLSELTSHYPLDSSHYPLDSSHYPLDSSHYLPEKDNIIPICDDDYFDDDITGRFINWVETIYGADTLEENLKFIADALGGRGSAREVIRNYFLNDFYADHVKMYQKRPIYWLFDSGKKGGFKALIYMHRYQPDIIARIRTDYVHEQQSRYRTAIDDLKQRITGASAGDRVKLTKQLTKLEAQAEEILKYEEKIHHLADQMIPIDLDDGVKVNYAKFADVLAKIK